MNNTLSSYLLCSAFMIIILATLAARSFSAVSDRESRIRTQFLIGMTALYVIVDFVFIACHLSGGLTVTAWMVVSFVFYLVYTVLPFVWHTFVRNFVGRTFKPMFLRLELIPIVILLALVVATPFTGALYSFDDAGMYTRGPLYTFYSILNYFYYAESILDLLIVALRQKKMVERYAIRTMLISLVMLVGAFVNGSVIPAGTIFPFMPFCSVIVTMLAFFFIASRDSDVTKEQQHVALEEALAKAEDASRVKTKFLSNMSHDIRTPMNAIINLTDLALKEDDPVKVHEYLSKMDISGNFLLGLINDVLDMSKIESGELVLHREKLTRTEFLNTIDTVIKPLVEAKGIHYHPELRLGEYTIGVDKLRFNQIFFNLLSNAVKYTPEGGDVWFEIDNLETENGRLKIRFTVRDNGIGMSPEFVEHIFEPFAREESDANIRTQGTGLGLAIVKSLVDAIGGTIEVKSELGKGSEFTVIFDVDIIARTELLDKESVSDDNIDIEGLHVLLVEDNEMNTYVAKIILEKAGCIVTSVTDGKQAVDLFTSSAPFTFDAILMDVRMPVMDGITATKLIRRSACADAATIPIIAMTADAFDDERQNTIESGMNYHLSKPVDAEKVYRALKECTTPPNHANRERNLNRDLRI